MATRTAPLFTVVPTKRAITIHVMDASGDSFTQRLFVAIAASAAAIEAWIALYQLCTNGTIWKITDELVREGDQETGNATPAYRAGVENGINLQFKNPTTLDTFAVRIVAPISTAMQGSADIPNLANTDLNDFVLATSTLAVGYSFKGSQYTTHRERTNNPRVRG